MVDCVEFNSASKIVFNCPNSSSISLLPKGNNLADDGNNYILYPIFFNCLNCCSSMISLVAPVSGCHNKETTFTLMLSRVDCSLLSDFPLINCGNSYSGSESVYYYYCFLLFYLHCLRCLPTC